LIVAVKYDNYRLLEGEKAIWLRYYNVKLKFEGELRWWRERMQQGRLIIAYDDVKGAWYAHIASEVKLKRDKREPVKCGIDLGQEQLAAAVIENGVGLFYRGTVLKSEYYYLKTRVSELDKRARFADFDVQVWLEKRKWLYRRFRVRKRELIKNMAAHLAKMLRELGVTEIYIGYPRDIKRDKPTEGNNAWPYWQTIKEIARAAENYGIAAYLVPEENTSKVCARHGCEVVRGAEGVSQMPLRARNARGLERGDEHPEKRRRQGAGARQSAQLHAHAGGSHRAEEEARKQERNPIAPHKGRGNDVARALNISVSETASPVSITLLKPGILTISNITSLTTPSARSTSSLRDGITASRTSTPVSSEIAFATLRATLLPAGTSRKSLPLKPKISNATLRPSPASSAAPLKLVRLPSRTVSLTLSERSLFAPASKASRIDGNLLTSPSS